MRTASGAGRTGPAQRHVRVRDLGPAAARLFCARDRFGIKPFYYTVAGGRFRFASEIKALLIDPEVARRPNHDRIVDYLAFELADHTAETMFEGIYQLPPGCFFTVNPKTGLGSVRRWYEAAPADLGGARFDEAVRERIFESVALRLRSDVPVGTCLSGGLDSSSVVTMASRLRADEGAPPPTPSPRAAQIRASTRCRMCGASWPQLDRATTRCCRQRLEVTARPRRLWPRTSRSAGRASSPSGR